MTLRMDGKEFKSFRAVCPRTRRQHARCTRGPPRGGAVVPARGGREAVAGARPGGRRLGVHGRLEDECEALPLKVLPPRSPELNGMVDRANRSERIECAARCCGRWPSMV